MESPLVPFETSRSFANAQEQRAIQIGMKGALSRFYVENALLIEDVTALAHAVASAHAEPSPETEPAEPAEPTEPTEPTLPAERPYAPRCSVEVYSQLRLRPDPPTVAAPLRRCFVCTATRP